MNSPFFSIITVTYNAENVLQRTLQSVVAQTFPSIEHIIIDGKSTDNTVKMIENYAQKNSSNNLKIKWLSEKDGGIYEAMNKGLQMASGKYVWFMNAGDMLYNVQTAELLAAQISNADIAYGETALVNDDGIFLAMRRLKAPENLTWKSFKMGMLVCHQAFVVRREITPLYNLQYRIAADIDWCIRCLKNAKNVHNSHLILCNFLTEGISSQQRKKALKERFKIMSHHYGFLPTAVRHIWFVLRFYSSKLLRQQL